MTTVIINNKSESAKKMIEFLKTQKYATVLEDEQEPGPTLKKSLQELNEGKVTYTRNVSDLLDKLKK
jgi:hypothetical protein